MFPGQADLAHEWASQPQLPAGSRNQPGPAIRCVGMARPHGGPAECLFEKAEGVLDRESPQVPAPQHAEIHWQRTTNPSQPQRPSSQTLFGKELDLDTN